MRSLWTVMTAALDASPSAPTAHLSQSPTKLYLLSGMACSGFF